MRVYAKYKKRRYRAKRTKSVVMKKFMDLLCHIHFFFVSLVFITWLVAMLWIFWWRYLWIYFVIFTLSLSDMCSGQFWKCCDYWIGGNDLAVEEMFTWTSDNSTLGFVNWRSRQPDDWEGNEDCISLCRDKRWNDYNCDRSLPYICESPAL